MLPSSRLEAKVTPATLIHLTGEGFDNRLSPSPDALRRLRTACERAQCSLSPATQQTCIERRFPPFGNEAAGTLTKKSEVFSTYSTASLHGVPVQDFQGERARKADNVELSSSPSSLGGVPLPDATFDSFGTGILNVSAPRDVQSRLYEEIHMSARRQAEEEATYL
ncbi:hypothetical protein BV25DRAFT_1922014 [Artomyces pyxidatus]|nr:hypothetical protein BV25DRAFT_1922014 [Artomyces pyxidatus]